MPRKKMTEEEKKAFGAKMKAAREAKKQDTPTQLEEQKAPPTDVQDKPDLEAMQRQLNEVMETNALLKAMLLRQPENTPQGSKPQVNQRGSLVGTFEKYALDPANYPDPTERLAAEPRLAPLAFNFWYVLDYNFTTRGYDTKQGIFTEEPEFTITLWRKKQNDDGEVEQKLNPKTGKLEETRYRARRLVFHEDPQAAMTIAHDNNIAIEKDDERAFLNEMRYLRIRDWLFDVFWPKPAQPNQAMKEEVIGNQLVEVVTVNSEQAADLTGQFAKISKKL